MRNKLKIFVTLLILTLVSNACTVVKNYEKVYLNDPDMELKPYKSEKFISTFQSYREGASGANGGKTGGGCGCN